MKNPEKFEKYFFKKYGRYKQRNVLKKQCRKKVDNVGILWLNEKDIKKKEIMKTCE